MWEKIKKRFLDFLLRQSVKNILYVFLLLFLIDGPYLNTALP